MMTVKKKIMMMRYSLECVVFRSVLHEHDDDDDDDEEVKLRVYCQLPGMQSL